MTPLKDYDTILYENSEYILFNEYEYTYLLNKINFNKVFLGDFYGDPDCGIIINNKVIVFGEYYLIYELNTEQINNYDLPINLSIIEIRIIDNDNLLLLGHPYNEVNGVWKYNLPNNIFESVSKDFDFCNKEYETVKDLNEDYENMLNEFKSININLYK